MIMNNIRCFQVATGFLLGLFIVSSCTIKVGYEDTVDSWLPRLTSDDTVLREAAAQALDWLSVAREEKERVIGPLLEVLEDQACEVRRNAVKALGRIEERRTAEALLKHTRASAESDGRVCDVAAAAYTSITGIEVTPEPAQELEATPGSPL